MVVRLYINGEDAYENFGASLGENALVSLMTPVPNKSYLENKVATQDGKQVLISEELPALMDERDVALDINIEARDVFAMLENYRGLCEVLNKGAVTLSTSFEPNKVYRLNYLSCSQMRTFFKGKAVFSIRFNEPNPANREP
ncbi:MAG: hypothetical protein MJZ41_07525 [Bacteroidaceae bacterium]|nr:hypothetical protein [Bacteroidaceae bacterium]